MHVFELTKTLVNIESVTGHEKACSEFLWGYLAARRFQVELQPVSRDRANVFAWWGNPEVVLSTHLDTVPPFFPAREDEEFIYGRGACDAKGIVASQIAAAERLLDEGVGDFGLLFVVGEETTSDGAREANLYPRGSRYIINGEPTENKLVTGSKGNLRLDILTKGKMAHSAYPHLGESAIEKLLDILADLRKLPLPEDAWLGPSTLNVGVIAGGRAANVIPDEARAQVVCPDGGRFRTSPPPDIQPAGRPGQGGGGSRHAGAAHGKARGLRNRCGGFHDRPAVVDALGASRTLGAGFDYDGPHAP